MKDILSFIKDALDELALAYKYAELDFYELQGEVLELLDKASEKGFGDPDYCELFIAIRNRFQTDVLIQSYYKKDNGKIHRFKKSLDLGCLKNVPNLVNARLANTGEVKIRISNFKSLREVQNSQILPTVDFKNLCIFTLKNAKENPIKKELHIKDNLFYYQVFLVYIYENGEKEVRTKYFGYILNMPTEVISKIAESEEKACYLDVTDTKTTSH